MNFVFLTFNVQYYYDILIICFIGEEIFGNIFGIKFLFLVILYQRRIHKSMEVNSLEQHK